MFVLLDSVYLSALFIVFQHIVLLPFYIFTFGEGFHERKVIWGMKHNKYLF